MSRTDVRAYSDEVVSQSSLPTVDIVMPVYNGETYLEEQVSSILTQSKVTVRLIALDDGSTDCSFALLKRMAAQDPRIKLLQNPKNLGLMRSISILLREVTGHYFALADQDDIWDTDKVAKSIATLRERSATLVYSDVRLIDSIGTVLKDRYLVPMGMRPLQGRDPLPFIFRNPAIGHTMVGTAELARAVGEIDPRLLVHEIWIVAAACKLGGVTFLNDQLGSYRQHPSNIIGARRNTVRRLVRLLSTNGKLWRRQQIRIRAISALAPTHPALAPIAKAQARHGVLRLQGLPRFTTFMLRMAPKIGLFPALTEIVLFPFGYKVPRGKATPISMILR
jgi:glycosyltransferase involved in cell wall biosynthesis